MNLSKYMIFLSWVLILNVSVGYKHAFGDEDMGKRTQLLNLIEKFSEENGIELTQSVKILNDISFGQQLMAKGGLGIVTKDVYVDLTSTENRIVYKNGGNWVGTHKDDTQAVLMINGNVANENVTVDAITSLIVLVFTPNEIRLYDLVAGHGGFYKRR